MAPASGSAELHIANTLRLAAEDFRASTLLRAAGNRFSAYHLQQSAEKLLLALLISEQIEFARKDSHRLDVLSDKLPDANPFKARLGPLVHLTLFATTYRYPKDGGRIPKMPSEADLKAWARSLERLLDDAFAHFGVDPNAGDDVAARTRSPPRRAGT